MSCLQLKELTAERGSQLNTNMWHDAAVCAESLATEEATLACNTALRDYACVFSSGTLGELRLLTGLSNREGQIVPPHV